MKNLDNAVVVITGAGSGMGREMALLAARQGALLAVSDWNEQGLAETVDLVKDAGAREVRSDVVDVSDRAAVVDLGRRRRRAVRPRQRARQQRRRQHDRRLRGDDLRRLRLDRRHQLRRRRQRHQGVPAPPDRLRRRPPGQHLQPVRPDQRCPARRRTTPPSTPSAASPRRCARRCSSTATRSPSPACTPAASRPASAATAARQSQDADALDELFDEKLAKMPADKAAADHPQGALSASARVLVGLDAHVLHHFAKLTGSRYQDVVARVYPKVTGRR